MACLGNGILPVLNSPQAIILLAASTGEPRGEALQRALEAEQSVDGATLTFMRQALPALPILVIGLALGEGKELVSGVVRVWSVRGGLRW